MRWNSAGYLAEVSGGEHSSPALPLARDCAGNPARLRDPAAHAWRDQVAAVVPFHGGAGHLLGTWNDLECHGADVWHAHQRI